MAAQTYVAAHGADHGASDSLHNRQFWALTLGSIGVVYGDIGTSPLYALREAVLAAKEGGASGPDAVIGVLSLMLWSLFLLVTAKYVLVLLRADNKGEGGTFALMALGQSVAKRSAPVLLVLGVAGASFFYGDAILTPAISVLSAVEGLKLVAPAFESLVLPVTVLILIALFTMQSHGTSRVGALFGPVTGAEALYADLGHFGRRPIQMAWLGLVLPALALNYLGQGALVLTQPEALENP